MSSTGRICSIGLILLTLVCSHAPQAQAAATDERGKVGLVLSGGGAKGAAHIGVLAVLEENRIPVDVITGTSMGAYVGGMYAMGLSAGGKSKIVPWLPIGKVAMKIAPAATI